MAYFGSDSEDYEDDEFEQQFHFQSQLPKTPHEERNSIPGLTQRARASDGYILPLSGKTLDEGESYSNNHIQLSESIAVLHFNEANPLPISQDMQLLELHSIIVAPHQDNSSV